MYPECRSRYKCVLCSYCILTSSVLSEYGICEAYQAILNFCSNNFPAT